MWYWVPLGILFCKDGKNKRIKIKTWHNEHNCGESYENIRATSIALAYYFKKKVQNNPKFKVKEINVGLEDKFKLNMSDSKLKKVKSMVLKKLEGSYLNEYNKLDAYAQESRKSNFGSDVVIQISMDAMEDGKKRFWGCLFAFKPSRMTSTQDWEFYRTW